MFFTSVYSFIVVTKTRVVFTLGRMLSVLPPKFAIVSIASLQVPTYSPSVTGSTRRRLRARTGFASALGNPFARPEQFRFHLPELSVCPFCRVTALPHRFRIYYNKPQVMSSVLSQCNYFKRRVLRRGEPACPKKPQYHRRESPILRFEKRYF